jgi:hypothetical protein
MLTEYVHEQTRAVDDELRSLTHSRPRYDRPHERPSRFRSFVRRLALGPAKAAERDDGAVPGIVIRPAAAADRAAVARLAEVSERRVPSGLVLVAEVETQLVAAVAVDEGKMLADLWRPTGDVVQLLELRSAQLRVGRERSSQRKVA